MDIQPWDSIKTTVPAAFATGQGPDIVTPDFNPGTVLEYAKAGTILSLDDLMGTGANQIDPAAMPADVQAGNTVDGTLYAVPANLATLMLYYNKALLSEAGISAPPATMDEAGELVASGLIVNMLDQRIHKLTPEFASYTIAKMGLWALTQTAAQGLAPHVRVNGIGPGPTLQGAQQSARHFANQRAATILGRGSNPADVTAALGFFLDSPSVTGQMIAVDGGQHLAWKTPDVLGIE